MEKVWFLTGASSGFGAALSKVILEEGHLLAATFRNSEAAEKFTAAHKGRGLGLVMDVTKEADVNAALDAAVEAYGKIDVLVNNAGYGTIGAIEEFSMEEIRQQMETNFFGAMMVTKKALPLMRKQGNGHIVQISSQAGFRAAAGFGLYNASKFALEGFSEALAQELAPFGIRVVIVEPGPFRTQFLAGSMKLPSQKIDAYKNTAVSQMYQYMEKMDGKQEGDPAKGAKAIVDYINSNAPNLRLPLGKSSVQGIRAKLASVEKDLVANEAIANSTVFD